LDIKYKLLKFAYKKGYDMITVCIVYSGEVDYIENCFRSLRIVGDSEVVVVGKDPCLPHYNYRYIEKEWLGDFSDMRNRCILEGRGNWFLHIDPDERMVGELDEGKLGKNDGWVVRIGSRVTRRGGGSDYVVGRMGRIHRKGYYFEGKVHESFVEGIKLRSGGIGELRDIYFAHLGYDIGIEELGRKMERNIGMLLGGDIGSRELYHLARHLEWGGYLEESYRIWRYLSRFGMDDMMRRRIYSLECRLKILDMYRKNNLDIRK